MLATALVLASSAFSSGGSIPVAASCSGADRSPALSWTHVPAGTKAFAIVVVDPDAKGNDGQSFVHWLGWNLPGSARRLAPGAHAPREGQNSFGHVGYSGPCPPPGARHEYEFRIYALDAPINLAAGAPRSKLVQAMHGHVKAAALLVGYFTSRQ
jgi:Raf kinase inhibitor-like YbhB/YbcL family protein